MANQNTSQITESIQSLRTETSPDSVTPQRVGDLLQAIVDLIKALSNVPEEEVVSVMAAVNQANSNAAAALAAANGAASAAAAQAIASFLYAATAQGVTLTIKQVSHGNGAGISVSLPIADASQAGIVLPATLQAISDAAAAVDNYRIRQLQVNYLEDGVQIGVRSEHATLQNKILLATTSRHGVMSSDDKTKLDALPNSGIVALDAAGRVPAANAPQMMIAGNMTGGSQDTLQPGDFYYDLDTGHIYYYPSPNADSVDMGVPSKNVIYCHKDTDILYRWTGSAFTPIKTNPNEGLELRRIRVYSAASKRYDIPSGVFAHVHPSTNVMNMNLLEPTSGVPFYRIRLDSGAFYNDNDALIVDEINWPLSLCWQNDPPTIDDIIDNRGVMVEIYDTWATFTKF